MKSTIVRGAYHIIKKTNQTKPKTKTKLNTDKRFTRIFLFLLVFWVGKAVILQ